MKKCNTHVMLGGEGEGTTGYIITAPYLARPIPELALHYLSALHRSITCTCVDVIRETGTMWISGTCSLMSTTYSTPRESSEPLTRRSSPLSFCRKHEALPASALRTLRQYLHAGVMGWDQIWTRSAE